MSTENSAAQFTYQIKRIKELYFRVNERLHVPGPEKLVKLELVPMFGFSLDDNLVGINFRVFYHYQERPPEEVLTEIHVETMFELKDLRTYFDQKGILILPAAVITTFIALAYTHTRAVFAQRLAGTVFQEIILQVINPEDVARHFFAYMFNEEREVIQTDRQGKLVARESVNVPRKKSKKIKIARTRG